MRKKYQPGKYKLKVKRSAAGAGLGLFAAEAIPKGVCLVEYIGRIISEREEYTSRSKYLFGLDSKRTIDGATRANIARYINHSCQPNAEVEIIGGKILIMSRRRIKAGEEIAYNYGKEYWRKHIEPKGCRCPKCLEKKIK